MQGVVILQVQALAGVFVVADSPPVPTCFLVLNSWYIPAFLCESFSQKSVKLY